MRSLLAESIAACDHEQLAALAGPLEALRQAHPDDLSVAIATALHALASADSSRALPALERLNALVEKSPLEPLPPGTRPNARQRTEAARQLPLWLVARACVQDSERPGPSDHATACRLERSRRPPGRPIRAGSWRCSASKVSGRSTAATAPGPRRPGTGC